jgi:hypothetical protein
MKLLEVPMVPTRRDYAVRAGICELSQPPPASPIENLPPTSNAQ